MSQAPFQSIRELHDAYLAGQTSPPAVVARYLGAAKASRLNAYLSLCDQRALEQARHWEDALKNEGKLALEKYPLLGVPMGMKDNLVIEGVRTTCASKMLDNYIPPYTATAVRKLESAGAITIGKTNLDEFAMGSSNENSAYGVVLHPDFPDYVPGGSSGGSTAAVRGGLCLAALGSDTGGSVRLPASYCGVVGLKPTYGRVSRYGLVAFASSLDQIGPLTLNVEDAARVLEAMSGHDPSDSTSAPEKVPSYTRAAKGDPDWKKIRIGFPVQYQSEGVTPEVRAAIDRSLDWFRSQGASIVDVDLPHNQYSIAIYYVVAVSEASSNLARYDGVRFGVRPQTADAAKDLMSFYKKSRANFGPEVKRRIILGTFALSSGYYDAYYGKACQVRRLVANDFQKAFEKVDLVVGPVSADVAFKRGEKSDNPLQMYLNDLFTIPANLAGLPAISVPCGKNPQGLPIGLHFVGPAFSEEKLLQISASFERGQRGAG